MKRSLKHIGMHLLLCLSLVCWYAPHLAMASASRKPNIIFIHADDLGYGDLSCYGQQKFQTPHLDRMAAEGMRFTQYYSGSTVCPPSRATLMTGSQRSQSHPNAAYAGMVGRTHHIFSTLSK